MGGCPRRLPRPDRAVASGELTLIPLNVSAPVGTAFSGVSIDFRYDAALIDRSTVQVQPTALTGQLSFTADTDEAGKIVITAITDAANIRGTGHLFDIYARARTNVPNGTCGMLRFARVDMYGPNGETLDVDRSDTGQICIANECRVGDLNGDLFVTLVDAIAALQVAVGKLSLTDCRLQSGDLNGDGSINSADATMLQRLGAALPINPQSAGKADTSDPALLSNILQGTESVSVSMEPVQGIVGENVEAMVSMDNPLGLAGFDLRVSYPPELSFIEAVPGSVGAGAPMEVKDEAGHVNISLSRRDAVLAAKAGGTALVTLRFRVEAKPTNGMAALGIEKCVLNGQYGDTFASYTQVKANGTNVAVTNGDDPVCCFNAGIAAPKPRGPGDGLLLAAVAFTLAAAGWRRRLAPVHEKP